MEASLAENGEALGNEHVEVSGGEAAPTPTVTAWRPATPGWPTTTTPFCCPLSIHQLIDRVLFVCFFVCMCVGES